jgi:hypothetical protein
MLFHYLGEVVYSYAEDGGMENWGKMQMQQSHRENTPITNEL